jgi:sulfoxide reductase heme-binding subunit YedZ
MALIATVTRPGLAPDRWLLWLVLMLPLAWMTWQYSAETVYYGEYLHWTGVQSARLLLLTLALTPLLRLLPRAAVIRWLMRRRRDIGLVTFFYALAHTVAYLVKKSDLQLIVSEGLEAGLLTGWVAFLVFIALAVTSNNASLRALGRTWRSLHKTVYVAAILTYLHWVLTAFDPTMGYVHGAVAVVLLLARLQNSSQFRSATRKSVAASIAPGKSSDVSK